MFQVKHPMRYRVCKVSGTFPYLTNHITNRMVKRYTFLCNPK